MRMANTTDFINTVYDELGKLVGVGSGTSSSFMLMAWPGYSLSPADFKRADAPNGPYDPEVAKEAFSQLANIVPSFNQARFENSGFQVDDLYEIVLASAIPVGATETSVATNPIYRLFADAGFEFAQARRGFHDDPSSFYYPAVATPNQWYDEAAAKGWAAISLNQSDIKPAPAKSAFVKASGIDLSKAEVWRLKPTEAERASVDDRIKKLVAAKAVAFGKSAALPSATKAAAPASRVFVAPTATAARASQLSGVVAARPSAAGALASRALFQRSSLPASAFQGKLDVKRANLSKPDLGIASLSQRLLLKSVIDRALPTRLPAPDTDGFHVSFRYCRVNIERPWLKLALLNTKNWWMFDTPAGEYSSGASNANPGMFPLLSTSFIAIRDLKITANWKQEDKTHLKSAASFGFFDLNGATVNNDTIEVKGLQVIASICNLTPKLPPHSPPE